MGTTLGFSNTLLINPFFPPSNPEVKPDVLQLMMMLRFFPSIALVLAAHAVATGSNRHPIKLQLDPRDEECEINFSLCSPTGASSVNTPAVGSELSSLYLDLVDSIQDVQSYKRAVDFDDQIVDHKLQPRGSKIGLCCRVTSTYHTYSNTDLLIQNMYLDYANLPFLVRCNWNQLPTPKRAESTLLLCTLRLYYPFPSHLPKCPPLLQRTSGHLVCSINSHFADHQITKNNRTNSRPTSSFRVALPAPLSQAITPRQTATL